MIAFLFPGQGSQYAGMGKDLAENFPLARQVFEEANDALGIDLATLCFNGPEADLKLTANTQPAILTTSVAALRVLQSETGIVPHYAAGHSLGEYSALHAAGVVSAEDAIRLVHKRGELMHREAIKNKGAMSALLGLTIDVVEEIVERGRERGVVSVANHNTAQQIVITGEPAAGVPLWLLRGLKRLFDPTGKLARPDWLGEARYG